MQKLSLLSFFLILMISSCGNQKSVVQKKTPFEIVQKTYQDWTGGKEGATGTRLYLKGQLKSPNVHFESVFFHGREEKVNAMFNNGMFEIDVNLVNAPKKDLKMTGNPAGEYGNEAPATQKEGIPFKLNKDEAVIYYTINAKDYYKKITGIKELEPVIYP